MPFQSEKQRRYLWANEPEIARDWTNKYGSRVKKQDGGIMEYLQNMNLRDVELYGGAGLGALGAGAGWQSMQDINAINQMAKLGKYGPGNPMPQAFMDKLKGAYTPSSVFKKTGYPTGLKNWFFSRSSPGHFGPVEKAIELSKAAGKHLPKFLSRAALPLELLRATPANADEANMTIEDFDALANASKTGVLGDEGITLDEFMKKRIQERLRKTPRGSWPGPYNQQEDWKEGSLADAENRYASVPGTTMTDASEIRSASEYPYFEGPRNKYKVDIIYDGGELARKMAKQQDDEDNVPLRFRNAEYLSDYFNPRQRALRQSNRYWNRGDARTIPQRFMGGLRNVGGDIMGGIRNIGQGVSNFAGNLRQGHTTQAGYNAARQARINQNRVLMRSNPKSLENLRINYARMGLNKDQIKQKVQNFQNVTNQISNQSAGNQQTGNQDRSGWKSPGAPGAPAHRTRELMYTGGLASIWPR